MFLFSSLQGLIVSSLLTADIKYGFYFRYGVRTSVCYLTNIDSERMMGSVPGWVTTKKDGTVYVVCYIIHITYINFFLTNIIQGKKINVTKYSNIIIKYGNREFIPGIRTPFHCKDICLLINGCKYWTHHDKTYNSKLPSSCAIVNGFNFISQSLTQSSTDRNNPPLSRFTEQVEI